MNRLVVLLLFFAMISAQAVALYKLAATGGFDKQSASSFQFETANSSKISTSLAFLEDSSHRYIWDTTLLNWSPFPLLKTYIDSYDSSLNKLNFRYVVWQDSIYENSVITNYVYDSLGKLTESLEFANSFGTWVLNERTLLSYYSSGRPQQEIKQQYSSGTWLSKRKTEYFYDSFLNCLKIENSNWDSSNWRLIQRDTFSYFPNHLLATKVSQDFVTGTWVNVRKLNYNYISLTLDKLILQEWNPNSQNWDNILRHAYTYDADGNMLVDLTQLFITFTNWSNYLRETRTFNSANQELTCLFETRQNNQWLFYSKRNQTYTNNGLLQSRTNKAGNGISNTIIDADSTVYFYHQLTDLHPLQQASTPFEIRPNPAAKELYVKINVDGLCQIRLYDSNAKLCLTLQSQSKEWEYILLNQLELRPGIYYCQLLKGTTVIAAKKIVLLKD